MAKRSVADNLLERQACLRRAVPSVPGIEDLMKHADRFGTDQVVETAAELGYNLDALVRLQDHCDRVDVAAFKAAHKYGSYKVGKSSEERCKALLGITEEESNESTN